MARETATTGDEDRQSGPTIKSVLIGLVLSLVIGGGSGFGLGYFIGAPEAVSKIEQGENAPKPAAAKEEQQPGEGEPQKVEDGSASTESTDGKPAESHSPSGNHPVITPLDPIVTNLSDPSEIWIRLELSVTSDLPLEPDLSGLIHQDLFAYVRAMRLGEMAGPSAFIDLKAELLSRARQRSDNRVQNIYVKTLVYE